MEAADHFAAMAARIEKIEPAEFAGAVVIVPPPGGGEPIVLLQQDPKPDIVGFYAHVETRVQIRKNELLEEHRNGQAWGTRR